MKYGSLVNQLRNSIGIPTSYSADDYINEISSRLLNEWENLIDVLIDLSIIIVNDSEATVL